MLTEAGRGARREKGSEVLHRVDLLCRAAIKVFGLVKKGN